MVKLPEEMLRAAPLIQEQFHTAGEWVGLLAHYAAKNDMEASDKITP